jgi:uncharacterized membrane protein YhaH (DUF805 family)
MRIHHLMIHLILATRRFKARGRAGVAALAITAMAVILTVTALAVAALALALTVMAVVITVAALHVACSHGSQ